MGKIYNKYLTENDEDSPEIKPSKNMNARILAKSLGFGYQAGVVMIKKLQDAKPLNVRETQIALNIIDVLLDADVSKLKVLLKVMDTEE